MKRVTAITLAVIMFLVLTVSVYAEYVAFKVKLDVKERIVIGMLLPKEASFAKWKIFNDLRNVLSPTEEEARQINLKDLPTGGVTANWDAVPEKEIVFGEVAEKFIVDALKKLDEQEKLLPEHISLYEKFVIRKKE